MSLTPAQRFLSALETYIDVRIQKGVLPVQRLHERDRNAKAAELETACEGHKDSLLVAIDDLMRQAKRPGI